MSRRTLVARTLVLAMAASVSVIAGPVVAADAAVTGDQPATPTAVEVFTVDPDVDAPELPTDVQFALQTAKDRAEAKPDDLAPPYVDPATSKVYAPTIHETSGDAEAPIVIDYATLPEEGTDVADDPEEEPPPGEEPPLAESAKLAAPAALPAAGTRTFYPVVRQVKYSQASLEATADAAITANVPGKEHIVATYLQENHNRIVVEVNEATEAMRTSLASLYGADKVAIFLDPKSKRPAKLSRNNDSNPYKGGSATLICTNGFSWNDGGKEYMLTAGHCNEQESPQRMWLLKNGARIGTWTKWDTYEWGSVKLPGQSTYAGDVALVAMYGANETQGRVYTGNKTSNSSRDVVGAQLAYKNKKYCTGGMNKGVICNWKITKTAAKVTYDDGEVGRNLFRGSKLGWCLYPGDSGGPVYTTRSSDGKVIAKGIISGGGGGGSDHYAGRFDGDDCVGWFSEVVRAEKAFPGAITKR